AGGAPGGFGVALGGGGIQPVPSIPSPSASTPMNAIFFITMLSPYYCKKGAHLKNEKNIPLKRMSSYK
ncbi:MAG TPA: hypothetical protein VKR41_12450, partial [Puia sp.]|nr:hypothetical protein [Puia sp.]